MNKDSLQAVLPWRPCDDPGLLIDGQQYYPHILQAIDNANHEVDIETYLMSSGVTCDQFITRLIAARKRGVKIRLLLDAVGSNKLRHSDLQKLREGDVEVRLFNPIKGSKYFKNLARDHRKIICIDQKIAYIGGAGISDHFTEAANTAWNWRDNMIYVTGLLAKDLQLLFCRCWDHHNEMHLASWRENIKTSLRSRYKMPDASQNQSVGRAITSQGLGNKPILSSLLQRTKRAQHRVWLATAYFYPSRATVRALCHAGRSGLDVRILVPGPRTDHPSIRYAGRNWYAKLLKANVKIYEYQPRFLHQKVALVDSWVTLGSCNFDRWNLRWNLEANAEIQSDTFAQTICAMLTDDLAQSNPIEPTRWHQRPWREKLLEKFWQLVARFLDSIEHH